MSDRTNAGRDTLGAPEPTLPPLPPLPNEEQQSASQAAVNSAARRWCVVSRVAVGAAVGWLVFTLLQRLISGLWWPWLLINLLPPYAFAVVPLLLLLLIPATTLLSRTMRPKATLWIVLTSIAALVMGFPHSGINLWAFAGARGKVPATAIKVVTWNMGFPDQALDPARVYSYLKSMDADVYLLQEHVYWDKRKGELGAIMPADGSLINSYFPHYHVAMRSEMLTISRFPMVAQPRVRPDSTNLNDSNTPYPIMFQKSKVLRTDLLVRGTVVSVYNVHISVQLNPSYSLFSTTYYSYVASRYGQRRKQLSGLVEDARSNRHPLLIAGDFNTSPSMPDIAPLQARFVDAIHANRSLYPTTWNELGLMHWWRLDWAFTTPDINVYRYTFPGARGLSDHRPQSLVISIKGGR
jgi:endonuclease/exonuclease/phosphatase (EEP) superfamily protein YafD